MKNHPLFRVQPKAIPLATVNVIVEPETQNEAGNLRSDPIALFVSFVYTRRSVTWSQFVTAFPDIRLPEPEDSITEQTGGKVTFNWSPGLGISYVPTGEKLY